MKHSSTVALLILSAMIVACSQSGGGGSQGSGNPSSVDKLESEITGIYQAILQPVNRKVVAPYMNGSLTLVRDKDEFIADVRLSGGPVSVLQNQNIHIGERCPDESDDLNGDGYIDAEEGFAVYKEILVPLDDDLNSQRIGLGIFPVTDSFGQYFWSRVVSFEKMMSDLYEEDINPDDEYVKLNRGESFLKRARVVVITGVPSTQKLPDTVAGRGRHTPHSGLPVACGVIRKLTFVPGEVDRDYTGIPVPQDGETVGGSGGYDDGTDFPTSNSSTGGTGNYGDDEEIETTSNSTEFGSTRGRSF